MRGAAPDALVGEVLDEKYRIEMPLGAGGMGAVFRAEHVGTGRPVAVKTILPKLVQSREALERFRREARATGTLRHPNIVDVTDFGVARVGDVEIAYLVMEYLQGTMLSTLLDREGGLPQNVAVDLIEQIALALEAAHQIGIVHRDLKPENIWLVPNARGGFIVRVLDFGIAKLREPESPPTVVQEEPREVGEGETMLKTPVGITGEEEEEATLRLDRNDSSSQSGPTGPSLTTAGSTLGTPAYMSPEQCAGAPVDERSDIYSLGVVAWECLVGRKPFEGGVTELVRKHLHETPPRADEVDRSVSASLATAVDRALQKEPHDRYSSARAMAGSMRVAIEGPGTILSRSAALFLGRFRELFSISWKAGLPQLLLTIPLAIVAWFLGPHPSTFILVAFVAVFLWGVTTTMTHVAFSFAVDQLRIRPLDALDASTVFGRMKERLGFDEHVPLVRIVPRLLLFYLKYELAAPVGQGDLAVQIGLQENLGPKEAAERCRLLAGSTKRAYNRVRFVILATVYLVPMLPGYLLLSLALLLNAHPMFAVVLAGSVALMTLPLIAIFTNPILSSALALLYFRARQAKGEDVDLASVTTSRL